MFDFNKLIRSNIVRVKLTENTLKSSLNKFGDIKSYFVDRFVLAKGKTINIISSEIEFIGHYVNADQIKEHIITDEDKLTFLCICKNIPKMQKWGALLTGMISGMSVKPSW